MNDSYFKIDALNWSKLRLMERSPAHFKHGLTEETDSMRMGSAAHMAILEPEKFTNRYTIFTGKVRRGKEWESFEFDATAGGMEILNQREMSEVSKMRDAVLSNPHAVELLNTATAREITAQWTTETEDAVFKCKGRLDAIGPTCIVDLKTTQCSSPEMFKQSMRKYGYHGQAAWYVDGQTQSLPYYIIAVESSAPYCVTVFKLSESVIESGRQLYHSLLSRLHQCQSANRWSGYSDDVVILGDI